MSLLESLPNILEESKTEYANQKEAAAAAPGFSPVEQWKDGGNFMALGDNLRFMEFLMKEKQLEGRLQLIYIDPPFYTKSKYGATINIESGKLGPLPPIKPAAYDDLWQGGMEDYLKMLCLRFYLAKDLLSEEGCFWVHLDWHIAHYVKILLDEIFGRRHFVNEIIWTYKSGGTGKRSFSRKHDTLLFYSKTKNYYFRPLQEQSYNRGLKPYRFKGVKEYRDEAGWYTMVNMKDVWQIDMVGRTSAERTGYATQKPESLADRIVESCSRPGDWCADFFGGSATLAAAAEKKERRWISCDDSSLAMAKALKRIIREAGSFTLLEEAGRYPSGRDALQVSTQRDGAGIRVTLEQYRPKLEGLPVAGKEKELVRKIIEQDSLSLLVYWSVDFHYDGAVHKARYPLLQGETVCQNQDFEQISIQAVDVFGNRTFRVLDRP